ncbi:DUF1538 domain-containing protein [Tindallia californiensis]|uniref:DUF1538 domain-containing protein n=1 Tax=Tindallia californiensis TaxID=159292 RepID=A0A1H3MN00_9FIRM|nr:DUF1538 domain-containing protein [Tindallia californiensis]SDY77966.1 Protein of unknown function [Tindallia californiensis]
MNIFTEKFKEVLFSVLPITLIVVLFHFSLTPLGTPLILRFIIGAGLVIIGLTIFLIGVDIGITPLGDLTGHSIAQSNKLWIVIIAGLILGFFISIAEPGLIVLANQVSSITSGHIPGLVLLITVSVGIAVMLALGFIRIVYNIPLYILLLILYGLVFILSIFSSLEFITIAFDASGATTGVLAVPFILALSVGVSNLKKDRKASEKDSFGLVAIASVGAILSVLVLNLFSSTESISGNIEVTVSESSALLAPFFAITFSMMKETILSVLPLLMILLILQKLTFKLKKRDFTRLIKGFVYTFIGLLIFLIGVNGAFMDVGTVVGSQIAERSNISLIAFIGFFLGVTTILAEPAVYVLTQQIEDVTSGYVKREAVLLSLSIGVGIAIALSMLRIMVPTIQLWHYLLPGYIISLSLMFIVPKLFVGIAFDAGGVATGPMTATFILAFTNGVADATVNASVLIDGFGMIATVALTPIITMQLLGLIFKLRSGKEGIS